MTIDELENEAHSTAREKGWWDEQKLIRRPLEIAALIHSEVSEFVECERCPYQDEEACGYSIEPGTGKPQGPATELADAVIRIADYMGFMGWSLDKVLRLKMDYNKTRTHRHGGKLA